MFSKWIVNILRFYNLWGFCTIPTKKPIHFFILIFHTILCAYGAFNALEAMISEHGIFQSLDAVNFLFYYFVSFITYWLIIYDSFTTQCTQHKFWKIADQINRMYSYYMNVKKVAYLSGWIMLLLLNLLILWFSLYNIEIPLFDRILHHIFLCVFDNRIFFYILHLKIIAFHLQKIEAQIKCLQLNEKRLNRISRQYRLVYEMSECVKKTFGWSHLGLIMLTFYTSVTFLNIAYRVAYNIFIKLDSGWLFI